MDFQQQRESSLIAKIKNYINKCKIVLRVTKKPTKQEFTTIVKVSGVGIAIIGVIGFAIQLLRQLLIK